MSRGLLCIVMVSMSIEYGFLTASDTYCFYMTNKKTPDTIPGRVLAKGD